MGDLGYDWRLGFFWSFPLTDGPQWSCPRFPTRIASMLVFFEYWIGLFQRLSSSRRDSHAFAPGSAPTRMCSCVKYGVSGAMNACVWWCTTAPLHNDGSVRTTAATRQFQDQHVDQRPNAFRLSPCRNSTMFCSQGNELIRSIKVRTWRQPDCLPTVDPAADEELELLKNQ